MYSQLFSEFLIAMIQYLSSVNLYNQHLYTVYNAFAASRLDGGQPKDKNAIRLEARQWGRGDKLA